MVQVELPDLGEGTKEATIKEWYVEPGTKVNEVSFIWYERSVISL